MQKYIITEIGQFIMFSNTIKHSSFKHLNPSSAGFCYIIDKVVKCSGESVTL